MRERIFAVLRLLCSCTPVVLPFPFAAVSNRPAHVRFAIPGASLTTVLRVFSLFGIRETVAAR
ncbi:MAG: hypothetical protein CXZ00_08525 [Acidobacteria bacterium]|nr:MAG: hypothetical protein CXZ00_08525 [Acidobacteriota bacterium]